MKTNTRKIESDTSAGPATRGQAARAEHQRENGFIKTTKCYKPWRLDIWYLHIYLGFWDIVFCLFLCVLACGVYPVFVKNLGMSQAWFLSLPFDLMRKGKSKSRKTRPPVNNRRSSFCFHSAAQFNLLLFYILPLLPYFTFFWWQGFP